MKTYRHFPISIILFSYLSLIPKVCAEGSEPKIVQSDSLAIKEYHELIAGYQAASAAWSNNSENERREALQAWMETYGIRLKILRQTICPDIANCSNLEPLFQNQSVQVTKNYFEMSSQALSEATLAKQTELDAKRIEEETASRKVTLQKKQEQQRIFFEHLLTLSELERWAALREWQKTHKERQTSAPQP